MREWVRSRRGGGVRCSWQLLRQTPHTPPKPTASRPAETETGRRGSSGRPEEGEGLGGASGRPDAPRRPGAPAPGDRSHATTRTSRPLGRLVVRLKNRRRPTLPGPRRPSTIGAVGLNCSVRNGKRCFPHAKATGNCSRPVPRTLKTTQHANTQVSQIKNIRQALDPLVPVSYTYYYVSRSGLSTWWSTRGLTPSRGWESSSRGRLPA